jgi:hypothetical protein
VTKSKLTGLRFRSSIAQHRYSIAESEVIARARSSIRSERSTPSTAGRTVLAHPTAVMTKAASQVEHSTPHQWRQERPQCGPFHRRVGVSLGTAQRLVACEELRIIIDVLFHEARTSKCLPSKQFDRRRCAYSRLFAKASAATIIINPARRFASFTNRGSTANLPSCAANIPYRLSITNSTAMLVTARISTCLATL